VDFFQSDKFARLAVSSFEDLCDISTVSQGLEIGQASTYGSICAFSELKIKTGSQIEFIV
jgi:hypothetical protein